MASLTTVEGIGDTYAKKLNDAGYGSTKDLLEKGATPQGRKQIAEKTGISDKLILRWINHIDLFRKTPTQPQVADWVEQAKTLPRVLSY